LNRDKNICHLIPSIVATVSARTLIKEKIYFAFILSNFTLNNSVINYDIAELRQNLLLKGG